MAAWSDHTDVARPVRATGARQRPAAVPGRAPHSLGEAERVRDERVRERERWAEELDAARDEFSHNWIYGTEAVDDGFDWYTNG